MLDAKQVGDSNVYELFIVGDVNQADIDRVIQRFDSAIAEHGTIRLLEVVEEVGSVDPVTLLSDARFIWRHATDFERVAVVGQKGWVKTLTKATGRISSLFKQTEVRYFDMDDLEGARTWVTA